MEKTYKVLVSNQPIPSTKVGSWTSRLTKLNQNNNVFDYVLSPSTEMVNSVFCKKRKFITWNRHLRKVNLMHWVAKEYVEAVKRLTRTTQRLTIIIMDDVHLLEAMIHLKRRIKCPLKIVFSFHGYRLKVAEAFMKDVDKVLFLSSLSQDLNKQKYSSYFPESFVVGNGVDSSMFYPLDDKSFIESRKANGFNESDEILIWAANDRPKKGLLIFYKILDRLLIYYPQLKIIIIGSEKNYNHPNVLNVGKMPNHKVASFMQISNYYVFTTLYEEGFGLSLVEAYKSGNVVMSTNKGAIPEVVKAFKKAYLINDAQNIDSWINAFEQAREDSNNGTNRIPLEEANAIWNYKHWEHKFIEAIS